MFDFSDTGELRKLSAHFRTAPEAMKCELAEGMSKVAENLIAEQFATGKDPYAKPYLPPKDGHAPPMVRSGKLKKSIGVEVVRDASGFVLSIRSGADYAKYLQNGTSKMKPRIIAPTSLPPHWRDAFKIVFEDCLERWITRPLRR